LFTVVSPTIAEYFGLREHGTIFGTVVLFGTLGGAAMPIVAGMVFDNLQSYQLAFVLLATMAIASLLCATRLASTAK